MRRAHDAPAVFSTGAGRALVERVCRALELPPARFEERSFEDGEHKTRPLESVRGRDVYLVESLYRDESASVNDKLVRSLFFIAGLRDAGARRVTLIAPYLCYARKDMRTKARDPVNTRYVAQLVEAMGTGRILTIDVHNRAAYENAFRIPAEHLTAVPIFTDVFARVVGPRDAVVVSPDAGGVKRAEAFRAMLERRLGRAVPLAFIEKFRSEGALRGGRLVGDVAGRVAILLDDLISSGRTLASAAKACREHGAEAVHAAATHGVFSPDAAEVLQSAELDRVVVLDTVARANELETALGPRLQILPCAPLLADAIRALHDEGSLVALQS
jgi:ribose-phosphate pyrophosphokinase